MFLVRDEYTPKWGRQYLTLWSGPFASVFEGDALELPNHDGYMVNLLYGPKGIRVTCRSPRNDHNFIEVDQAINDQLRDADNRTEQP